MRAFWNLCFKEQSNETVELMMNILANKNFDISLRDVAHEYDSTLHYLVQKNHF